MERFRYIKTIGGQVPEYYEFLNYTIDYFNKMIIGSFVHVTNGDYPILENVNFNLQNNSSAPGALNSSSYMIDPTWNESSVPPRPAGISLDDPETWGDLTWEQIPKILITHDYFDDFLVLVTGLDCQEIEEAILNILLSKDFFPETEEWSVSLIV